MGTQLAFYSTSISIQNKLKGVESWGSVLVWMTKFCLTKLGVSKALITYLLWMIKFHSDLLLAPTTILVSSITYVLTLVYIHPVFIMRHQFITPWIKLVFFTRFTRIFPLSFSWQTLPSPFTEGFGIIPRYMYSRMVHAKMKQTWGRQK